MTDEEALDRLRECAETYEDAASRARDVVDLMEGLVADTRWRQDGNVEYLLNLLFGISREMGAAALDGSVTRDDAARWAKDVDRITEELCGEPGHMRRIRL
jgi:hypothetical protein